MALIILYKSYIKSNKFLRSIHLKKNENEIFKLILFILF
jgi:hypothetical protein